MCAAAVVNSGVPGADERRVAQVMGAIADRVCDQFVNPYIFPSFHERILEPYNYYQFGQVLLLSSLVAHTLLCTNQQLSYVCMPTLLHRFRYSVASLMTLLRA